MIADAAFMFGNVGLEFSLGFAYIAKATGSFEKVNYKLSMRRKFILRPECGCVKESPLILALLNTPTTGKIAIR